MSNTLNKFVGKKLYYSHGEKNSESNEETFITKIITESSYRTNNENLLLVKDVELSNIILDSETTTHIIIKSLTNVIVTPSSEYIDEYFTEIELERGSCVEFYNINGNWYILSSDGLKLN